MADADITQLHERLLSDDALREQFRTAPHEVLEAHGISVTEEQKAKLQGLTASVSSHEELKATLTATPLRAYL